MRIGCLRPCVWIPGDTPTLAYPAGMTGVDDIAVPRRGGRLRHDVPVYESEQVMPE
jgi:hypothetical protein